MKNACTARTTSGGWELGHRDSPRGGGMGVKCKRGVHINSTTNLAVPQNRLRHLLKTK